MWNGEIVVFRYPPSTICTSRCNHGVHQESKLSYRYSAYARSKLCNVLHTAELQRRLRPAGIQAFSVSPGRVYTGMTANLVPSLKWLIEPLVRLSFQSPAQVRYSFDTSRFLISIRIASLLFHSYLFCRRIIRALDGSLITNIETSTCHIFAKQYRACHCYDQITSQHTYRRKLHVRAPSHP